MAGLRAVAAGVPKSIVRIAKKQLTDLETKQAGQHPQGDLFVDNAPNPPPIGDLQAFALMDAVDDLKPDELSPKEALEILYRLKTIRLVKQ